MGYLREKYSKEYFLRQDPDGNPAEVGVVGIEEFRNGDIRAADKDILERVDFQNRNVLELGFGRGEAIKFALDAGARKVVGVDFSEDSKRIASEFLKKHGLEADLHCEDAVGFLEGREAADLSFEIVILLDFVEHVPREELEAILRILHGCLIRTGRRGYQHSGFQGGQ